MAEDKVDLPWGIPEDAPPPRRRTGWGLPTEPTAPVHRADSPLEADAPVAAPNWSPIMPTPDPLAEDLAAHMAGSAPAPGQYNPFADAGAGSQEMPAGEAVTSPGSVETPVSLVGAESPENGPAEPEERAEESHEEPDQEPVEDRSVEVDDSDAVGPSEQDAEPSNPFGVFSSRPADPNPESSAITPADPDPGTEVGADIESGTESGTEAGTEAGTGTSAGATSDEEEITAVDGEADTAARDEDILPSRVGDPETLAAPQQFLPPSALVSEAADLSSMSDLFGDDLFGDAPVPGTDELADTGPTDVAPAPLSTSEPYSSREDALTAWRAMQSERAAQAASAQEAATAAAAAAAAPHSADAFEAPTDRPGQMDATTHRYLSAERLSGVVDRVLALNQSGDPQVQAAIGRFVLTRDPDVDRAQRTEYEQLMLPLMQANLVHIENPADVATVLDLAYDELIGIGPLGPLWREDDVTEIIVSGPENVTVERNGALVATGAKFKDLDHLRRTARDLAQRVDDRTVSRSNPLVTAQLPGARVQFAMAPVAPVAGVSITIRKFRPLFGLEDLLKFGALDDQMAAFLNDAVAARATVLVSGGTGSGKTTMINALSSFIPDSERVITIEDALELKLSNTHVESLLTKELASGDDRITIGQDELLRASLRMRPDRIIVGEIRDGKGCATMLQAANTGHDGTMTTVHANNPDLAMRRLQQLLRGTESMTPDVAREEIQMAFDLIVQVVRFRGRRFVSHISVINEPDASTATTTLFSGDFPLGAEAPSFRRVAGLGSDTELAQRMFDAGLNPDHWR